MQKTADYDIIIAGAGAAGLSLLWHILNSDSEEIRSSSILVADRSFTPANDKTWCFWDTDTMPFDNLIHHTWNQLDVKAHNQLFSSNMDKYKYHCIRSKDYAEKILKMARDHSNVTLLETGITDFGNDENGLGYMLTCGEKLTAPWIFQSALKPPGFDRAKVDMSLMQHFLGWEIESSKPIFNPDKATLMDFDVNQEYGVAFMYLLPFTEHKALLEYTLFSSNILTDAQYESAIQSYLNTVLNLQEDDYTIVRKEKGVIPMEDRRYSTRWSERVYNTGTVGGLTKPSTGYTFTRIQQQSAEIVKALEQNKQPELRAASEYRFRVYDMMLLYLLETSPDTSVVIFRELFKRNTFDRILTFLEEKTSFPQELRIFASLPYMPFFRAIWNMKHRIFTGA
jgi:lycopene beta-cyclase